MADRHPSLQTTNRPRALAELGYNSLSALDTGTSSEEDTQDAGLILASDAHSLVGVSIGRAQTRLTSPKIPAVEKAAALEAAGGLFEPDFDPSKAEATLEEHGDEEGQQLPGQYDGAAVNRVGRTQRREPEDQSAPPLPSPWRAGPKQFQRTDGSRGRLREAYNRRRASSGPTPTAANTQEGWQKYIPSLPSLPKYFSMTSPFSFNRTDNESKTSSKHKPEPADSRFAPRPSISAALASSRKSSNQSVPGVTSPPFEDPQPRTSDNEDGLAAIPTLSSLPVGQSLEPRRSRQLSLRRSASDTSLVNYRTLSRVSSLGDDSRFENVREQVNSRAKAIRDSFQDTNVKLPSLPSLASLRADFAHARNSTLARRNSWRYGTTPFTHQRDGADGGPPTPDPKDTKRHVKATGSISAGGPTSKTALTHPHFTKAVAELEGDIVVLGGYRGSILRSAEPPHRQLWVPIKVGLNIRKVDLEVGLDPEDDETMEQHIIPGGMLANIGPVDISRRLFKRLRASDSARAGRLRIHDYGYDWRLDPHVLSRRLIEFLERLPCNRPGTPPEKRGAIVIAHSTGGLITRHAVNQRPELFRGVVYAAVPTTCVNILGPLRNGDDVLLSSRVLTAQVNFTIRTSYLLLPLEGKCFFNKYTREEYPVDFFDIKTWIDYRLSPCIARPLPPLVVQPQSGGISGIMSSMASVLPSLPGMKNSISDRTKNFANHPKITAVGGVGEPTGLSASGGGKDAVEQGNIDPTGADNADTNHVNGSLEPSSPTGAESSTSIATAVTIPRDKAIAYLTRTLASVKKFKQELAYDPSHGEKNIYPPAAVIYGKSTPTVFGAKVASREAIKHADAYDELAFASGDGVVLARAAMLPEGYQVVKGGIVSSDRGHVTLLGDLEAVGKCLNAVVAGRRKGVGVGA